MTRAPKTKTPISVALETACDQTGMPATPIVAVRKVSIAGKTQRVLIEARKTHAEAACKSAAGSACPSEITQVNRFKSP